MKRTSRWLIIVIIPLLLFLGVKGVVHFKVRSEVDHFITMADPFVTIRYESISTSLLGVVALEGVSVVPRDAVEVVRIGELKLDGGDAAFLLQLTGGLSLEAPPEKLYIAAHRIELPLDGGYLFMNEGGGSKNRPAECTLGGILQHVGLDRLDYTKLQADMVLGYRYNPTAATLAIDLDFSLQDIESFQFTLLLSNLPTPGGMMTGAIPVLSEAAFDYQLEPDYIRGMTNYCAKQAGRTPAAFINTLFAMSDQDFSHNLGFVPGRGLRAALKSMISRAAPVEMKFNPVAGFDLRKLGEYSTGRQIALLGMELSVGGKRITDLDFSAQQNRSSTTPGLFDGGDSGAFTSEDQSRSALPRARYIETGMNDLERYLGYDVRIYQKNQKKPKVGILNKMKEGVLEVEQRLHGGKMTMQIAIDRVERVEVMRRR